MTFKKSALVMFDLDGTLVHFHHEYLFSETDRILASFDLPIVDRSVKEESFAAFDYFRFLDPTLRNDVVERFWNEFDWENFPLPKPLPGVIKSLQRLQAAGYRMAIVTSRLVKPAVLKSQLEGTGLLELMSGVTSRQDEAIDWSDKRPLIQETCERFSVNPVDCVFAGDSPSDVSSACDCAIGQVAAVLSGGIRRDILLQQGPTWILSDVNELATQLLDSSA